jgi:hypothetical protein
MRGAAILTLCAYHRTGIRGDVTQCQGEAQADRADLGKSAGHAGDGHVSINPRDRGTTAGEAISRLLRARGLSRRKSRHHAGCPTDPAGAEPFALQQCALLPSGAMMLVGVWMTITHFSTRSGVTGMRITSAKPRRGSPSTATSTAQLKWQQSPWNKAALQQPALATAFRQAGTTSPHTGYRYEDLPPCCMMNLAKASSCCLRKVRVGSSFSSPVLSSNLEAQLPIKISGLFRVSASRNTIILRKSY